MTTPPSVATDTPVAVFRRCADRAVLVYADAGADRGRAQAVGELAGVDERGTGPGPQRAEVCRRVHLGADLLAVEQFGVVAEPAHELGFLLEVGELARLERDDQVAGGLELGVDLEPLHICGERVEVFEPEPLELVELGAETRQAVADPVRER